MVVLCQVVAKIESIPALKNLDGIVAESDGVMIARGNLGTYITPEKVFLAQSMITTKVRGLCVLRHWVSTDCCAGFQEPTDDAMQ